MDRADQCLSFFREQHEYFVRIAEMNPSLAPEAEAAAELIEIVETRGYSRASVLACVAVANRLAGVPHYNGSGWFWVKVALVNACAEFGIKADFRHGGHLDDPGIEIELDPGSSG